METKRDGKKGPGRGTKASHLRAPLRARGKYKIKYPPSAALCSASARGLVRFSEDLVNHRLSARLSVTPALLRELAFLRRQVSAE